MTIVRINTYLTEFTSVLFVSKSPVFVETPDT